MREELNINEYSKAMNKKVFDEMHAKVISNLLKGKNCIFDATNLISTKRKELLEYVKDIDCERILIWVLTDLKIALQRNRERNKPIPNNVIKKMYSNIEIPLPSEEWNELRIIVETNFKDGNIEVTDKAMAMSKYIQEKYKDKKEASLLSILAYYIGIGQNYSYWKMRKNSHYDACIFLSSMDSEIMEQNADVLMAFANIIASFYNFNRGRKVEVYNEKDLDILGVLKDAYDNT